MSSLLETTKCITDGSPPDCPSQTTRAETVDCVDLSGTAGKSYRCYGSSDYQQENMVACCAGVNLSEDCGRFEPGNSECTRIMANRCMHTGDFYCTAWWNRQRDKDSGLWRSRKYGYTNAYDTGYGGRIRYGGFPDHQHVTRDPWYDPSNPLNAYENNFYLTPAPIPGIREPAYRYDYPLFRPVRHSYGYGGHRLRYYSGY